MGDTEGANKMFLEMLPGNISKIIDQFGQIQTIWGSILTIVLLIAFIYAIISFCTTVNKRTKRQIQFFMGAKKYEPSLFIELNQNLEYLRYFLFGYKWKKRITQQYNKLFRDFEGEKIRRTFDIGYPSRLSRFTKISDLYKYLNSLDGFFESIRSERESCRKEIGEYFFIVRNLGYVIVKVQIFCTNIWIWLPKNPYC